MPFAGLPLSSARLQRSQPFERTAGKIGVRVVCRHPFEVPSRTVHDRELHVEDTEQEM